MTSAGIYAEHLKHCRNLIIPLLSMCFSSLFVHGCLPEAMISVVLVPIVKNKSASICSKSNYRPIALASIVSKVLEKIIYDRIVVYLNTCSNQFGFKAKHKKDMTISTTYLAACVFVCGCAKFDQFLPVRSHFDTTRPVHCFHIATFPSPTFGPLFAFHCPLFFYGKQ